MNNLNNVAGSVHVYNVWSASCDNMCGRWATEQVPCNYITQGRILGLTDVAIIIISIIIFYYYYYYYYYYCYYYYY